MPNDLTAKNLKQAIEAAIASLKDQGWDINPYSVADAAQIARSTIIRDPDLMEAIKHARTESSNGHSNNEKSLLEGDAALELMERVDALEEENKSLEEKISQLQQELESARCQKSPDREPNEERVRHLEEELRISHEQKAQLEDERKKFFTVAQTTKKQLAILEEDKSRLASRLSILEMENREILKNYKVDPDERVISLQQENSSLSEAVTLIKRQKDQIEKTAKEKTDELQQENQALAERVQTLETELTNMAKTAQLIWQQGFLAGHNEAQEKMVAAAREAMQSSAALDALSYPEDAALEIEEAAAAQAHQPGFEEESALYAEEPLTGTMSGADQSRLKEAFDAEATLSGTEMPCMDSISPDLDPFTLPINLDDPDIANDAFTARLIEALQAELAYEQEQALRAAELGVDPNAAAAHDHDMNEPEQTVFTCGPDGQVSIDSEAVKGKEFSSAELRDLLKSRLAKEQAQAEKELEEEKIAAAAKKRFVGSKRESVEPPPTASRQYPPEIRRALLLLGVRPDEAITKASVLEAWKREMAKPGVHPDTGGDTEMAIYLNTAKDRLLRWVEAQTPKLGKKFGAGATSGHTKQPGKGDKDP